MMSCFLYYESGEAILTDREYDEMCAYLLQNMDEVKGSGHPHAQQVTEETLTVSGHALQYSALVRQAALRWSRE